MKWRIRHKAETASTNLDARRGVHGDVFTADWQSAGRGRLDHKWHSARGENLIMSAVLSVEGVAPERAATLPLVAGLAVTEGLESLGAESLAIKWPNDVLAGGRKIAGILCERHGDNVVVGVGVNVNQRGFPEDLRGRATSLAVLADGKPPGPASVAETRDAILDSLGGLYAIWREGGLEPLMDALSARDALKGTVVSVRQADDDGEPVTGVCGGIAPDGSLDVGGVRVWAGEAHIESFSPRAD